MFTFSFHHCWFLEPRLYKSICRIPFPYFPRSKKSKKKKKAKKAKKKKSKPVSDDSDSDSESESEVEDEEAQWVEKKPGKNTISLTNSHNCTWTPAWQRIHKGDALCIFIQRYLSPLSPFCISWSAVIRNIYFLVLNGLNWIWMIQTNPTPTSPSESWSCK